MHPEELAATGLKPAHPVANLEPDRLEFITPGGPRAKPDHADEVLDPTVIARRRRKHTHARVYRLTQFTLLLAFLSAIASLVSLIFEEPEIGRSAGAASAALGAIAFWMTTSGKLAERLRGYAAAAVAMATVAIGANLLPISGAEPESHPAPPPHKTTRNSEN